MGLRRAGREATVKILYSLEFSDATEQEAAGDYWMNHKSSKKLKDYAMSLVSGVREHQKNIDVIISGASKNWSLERLPNVDRNILRLAVFELLECQNVPMAVIINEAVEIAKRYSGKDSASFVNGVLGKIQAETRKKTKYPLTREKGL